MALGNFRGVGMKRQVDEAPDSSVGGPAQGTSSVPSAGRKATSRKASPKKAKRTNAKMRKPTRTQYAAKVVEQMSQVRRDLREIGDSVLRRLDAEITGVARYLGREGQSEEPRALPATPVLEAMLAELRALKVKPKKGRVKDLQRIDKLLISLFSKLPPGA